MRKDVDIENDGLGFSGYLYELLEQVILAFERDGKLLDGTGRRAKGQMLDEVALQIFDCFVEVRLELLDVDELGELVNIELLRFSRFLLLLAIFALQCNISDGKTSATLLAADSGVSSRAIYVRRQSHRTSVVKRINRSTDDRIHREFLLERCAIGDTLA